MASRNPALLMTSVLLILLFSVSAPAKADEAEPRVASALLGHFETVFYSNAGLLLNVRDDNSPKAARGSLRLPFRYLLGALDSLGYNAKSDVLTNAAGVMVGAKDFLPPAGLGAVRSHSCYVVVLRQQSKLDLHKYLPKSPLLKQDGIPIWRWSANLGEYGEEDPKPSWLYTTQVAESYVLVSNDLEDLKAIASRLTTKISNSEVLSQVPEWRSVSAHEMWGYRRYRHAGIVNREAAGMSVVTSTAQYLFFWANMSEKVGMLRLVAADNRTVANINSSMPLLRLDPVGKNAWEANIPILEDQKSSEAIFDIMDLFGFGVYV